MGGLDELEKLQQRNSSEIRDFAVQIIIEHYEIEDCVNTPATDSF